jgi:hypothetical protein
LAPVPAANDRCGRRVKAFLFLHDVREDGRPTLIAPGSHRTTFYAYNDLKLSRFADSYVEENYAVTYGLARGNEGDESQSDARAEAYEHGRPRRLTPFPPPYPS